jgi:16S rRNA (guanine966-N2)-methyltransferase
LGRLFRIDRDLRDISMRVIAGSRRGTRLDAPPGDRTRPITDRVKETLFNILGARLAVPGQLPDGAVLDLFAGSGGLGIEALSRGAESAVFVERDRRAASILNGNLARAKLAGVSRVISANVWTMRLPRHAGGFMLIFADPPYRECADVDRLSIFLQRLATVLAPDGFIVLRHGRNADVGEAVYAPLVCVDHREYAGMHVLLLTHPQPEPVDGDAPALAE